MQELKVYIGNKHPKNPIIWRWEMEYFFHISKQGYHCHQWFWPSRCESLSPKVTQEGRKYLGDLAATRHSLPWALRNSGCEKHRILDPDSWDAYERNDFNEPRLSPLPLDRKALNSLTWAIWFSLIHKLLSMFNTFVFYCKVVYIQLPLTSLSAHRPPPTPSTSTEQFSQGYMRHCLLCLKS